MKIGVLAGDLSSRGGGIPSAIMPLYRCLSADSRIAVTLFGRTNPAEPNDSGLDIRETNSVGTFGYSPSLGRLLDAGGFDLLHTHGLWTYASIAARRWQKRHRRPVIVSPHGMLDPWALARSRWKKKVARAVFEHRHVANASCLHALNDAEKVAARGWGYAGPVAVIPNGIDLPADDHGEVRSARDAARAPVMLFLGRIDPKKGVRELIEAWHLLRERKGLAGWRLAVAGWGADGYVGALRQLAKELALGDTLSFVGPRFGAEKEQTYRDADAFILPSHSEGMPMTVLEAWSFGLPVLMTRDCHLDIGFERGAAVAIEAQPAALAAAIGAFVNRSASERWALGAAGRKLVASEFTWEGAARRLSEVYQWRSDGGALPSCVESEV